MKLLQLQFIQLLLIGVVFFSNYSFAQTNAAKRFSTKPITLADTLQHQFESKRLTWPPHQLYIRTFKYDKVVEVWVNGNEGDPFKFFKTYKMCMQSGTLGPKRMEGDFQMPEGFYYIDEFKSNSSYHLGLRINYPNTSDKTLGDDAKPGGDIYIHGGCVSTGCFAINDKPIEELYLLASITKDNGQDFIPVHIFPVNYNAKRSFEYLAEATKDNQSLQKFAVNLKTAFDLFEETKRLPIIIVNKAGEYLIY